ncbi:MAG TPA: SAM-dependent methyltransferase [Planctomycetes bacterium]|nr:SAM-dependent methyltransferase [Planctomycetota bacterium]
MDTAAVASLWNQNAENWTLLSRQGFDVFRDHVNTPGFLELLPDVAGLEGLDIGCGEGTNTRTVASLGASMQGVDVAERFVAFASEREARDPRGIRFQLASATALPFADASFDFATAFMSFMDLPEQGRALAEAFRVLRPGGFFQFSICHPCFHLRRFNWIRDEEGQRIGLDVGHYFDPPWGEVEEWTFSSATEEAKAALPEFAPFKVPRFGRTLTGWLDLIFAAGFQLERTAEPSASDEALAACPRLAHTRLIAFSLILRCRKPGDGQGR